MTGSSTTRVSLRDLEGRIGLTLADAVDGPELGAAFWADAELVEPENKRSVHLRVDADVFDFFKKQGKGHLTRMNAVLRAYVNAHR